MDVGVAIHTAARHYCLERHAHWAELYMVMVRGNRDRDGYHYTPDALNTFPRYQILNAIRVELETIDPAGLSTFESARELAALAGETADDLFTRNPSEVVQERAMAEEREAFREYVLGLTRDDLAAVSPLAYQRVLSVDESKMVWTRLRARWRIEDGYWYPLTASRPADVAAFDTIAFGEGVLPQALQTVLQRRGVTRLWELREYGPEYEQEVTLFDPHYNGAEGYWSSGDMDWIVYASHEGSVTFGGWLLDELKVIWPAWETHLWRGVF